MEKSQSAYLQLHAQIIFGTEYRMRLIPDEHREKVEKYICGIGSAIGVKVLAIYCNPDHTHILIGFRGIHSLSEVVRVIKSNSSKWINEQGFTRGKFRWQSGYGAFSYAQRDLPMVINYIINQAEHHEVTSFHEDYQEFLKYMKE